jgi:XTP/dITP diphosphohydrolase
MKVLLATHNPAKINDYRKILREQGVESETLEDLGIKEDFIESYDTFEANARAKALFYYNLAQRPTLADDGGFEIDYLNGEPGVKSRRWLGRKSTDQELVDKLSKVSAAIPPNQRMARFTTVICLVKSEKEIYSVKNSIEGYLTPEVNNNYPPGFPYRACFMEKTFNKYLMDLSPEEYGQINHRRKNVQEILKYLK